MTLALLFPLLFAAPPARAGSWSGPVYTFSGTDNSGDWSWPGSSGSYFDPNTPGYSGFFGSVLGTVTATFTWVPDPNAADDPPTPLCVLETASAFAVGGNGPASADDGLGDTAVIYDTSDSTTTSNDADSLGSHLALGGTTSPVVLTHNMSVTCDQGIGEMYYQVSGYPVVVGLGGTTQGSDGSVNILIGQGCTAGISGGGGTLSDWMWTIKGTPFQSWSGGNATQYVGGPGPTTNSTAHWYWNEKATTETVSCTATVTPSTGQGAPFSVTAMKQVSVVEPSTQCSQHDGVAYVNPAGDLIQATPASSTYPHGSTWDCRVSTPSLFGSGGSCNFVQKITPGRTKTISGTVVPCSENGMVGLDTSNPYPATAGDLYAGSGATAGWPTDNSKHQTGDSPSTWLDATVSNVNINESFSTYLMYCPPGSDVQPVPLYELDWAWSANLSQPQGGWATPNGINGDNMKSLQSTPTYVHPKWVRVESPAVGTNW